MRPTLIRTPGVVMSRAATRYRNTSARRLSLFLFAVMFTTSIVPSRTARAASASQSPDTQTATIDVPSVAVTGYFNARYVFRSAETASVDIARDQDVYGELRIDATTPKSGRYGWPGPAQHERERYRREARRPCHIAGNHLRQMSFQL